MPVAASQHRSVVGLVRAREDLVSAVDDSLNACGMGDCVSRGDLVLVKPNLHGGHGHTAPQVMAAACRWAFGKGARRVLLGDGPYWGMADCGPYFTAAGVYQACAESGAEPVFFHAYPYRLHHPQDPQAPRVLGVSRHLHEADVVINLPVMKTHFHTLITIALKNVKGCLRPVDKRRLHGLELNVALGVVNEVVQPLVTVTLCDATTAYEGFGPSSATPVSLGLLVASRDPVAVDAVCCQLMELDPRQVRLIGECATRGVGVGDPARIEVAGERVEDHRRRFERPQEALARQFPGLTIHGQHACSVCSQNLVLALQEWQQTGRPLAARSILIGAGDASEAELLVGACALRGRRNAAGVPGCPPAAAAICEALGPGARRS
jgi:uncharacterized protein (DUF362 family)